MKTVRNKNNGKNHFHNFNTQYMLSEKFLVQYIFIMFAGLVIPCFTNRKDYDTWENATNKFPAFHSSRLKQDTKN